ncbi:MAG TPA: aldo/keto reductase [Chitinophagaceae bacterium]|jgi:diketogulonate reductase-like aldo/keto reductase
MLPKKISRRQMCELGIYTCGSLLLPFDFFRNPLSALQQRSIPSSSEKIPVVGVGTWRTFDAGNNMQKRETLKQVLRNLVNQHASVIDSSPMYGSSESVAGDLSDELKIRPSLFLATKVWTTGEQAGIEQMNDSFRKMKATVIDLMQVHNLLDVKTHLKTLYQWKEQGKIRYIGITHYLPSYYDEMQQLIQKEKLDFIQCCYNIQTTDAEKRLLPLASDKGVAVLINRPFQEGALFGEVSGKPLPAWTTELGIQNWAQFFLKFILSNPSVTCVIPGTSNPNHLLENIQAGNGPLPDEKIRRRMLDYFNQL